MRKTYYITIIAAMMLLAGCGNSADKTVATNTVQEADSAIEVYGKAKAMKESDVYINFLAQIKNIYVEEGDLVKKGDKLMSLDYEQYKNEVLVSETNAKLDQTQLDKGIEQNNTIASEIQKLEKDKALKESYLKGDSSGTLATYNKQEKVKRDQIEKLKEEIKVKNELLAAGGATAEEIKNDTIELNKLESELLGIQKSIALYKDEIQTSLDEIELNIKTKKQDANDNNISNNRVEVEKALKEEINTYTTKNKKDNINQTYIKGNDVIAEFEEGIIEEVACRENSYIGYSGPTYCFRILDANSVQIVANVPEEFIREISVGQECDIVPYYDNSISIKGKVDKISNMAIKEDGEVIVQVYINVEDDVDINPGLSVDVSFHV